MDLQLSSSGFDLEDDIHTFRSDQSLSLSNRTYRLKEQDGTPGDDGMAETIPETSMPMSLKSQEAGNEGSGSSDWRGRDEMLAKIKSLVMAITKQEEYMKHQQQMMRWKSELLANIKAVSEYTKESLKRPNHASGNRTADVPSTLKTTNNFSDQDELYRRSLNGEKEKVTIDKSKSIWEDEAKEEMERLHLNGIDSGTPDQVPIGNLTPNHADSQGVNGAKEVMIEMGNKCETADSMVSPESSVSLVSYTSETDDSGETVNSSQELLKPACDTIGTCNAKTYRVNTPALDDIVKVKHPVTPEPEIVPSSRVDLSDDCLGALSIPVLDIVDIEESESTPKTTSRREVNTPEIGNHVVNASLTYRVYHPLFNKDDTASTGNDDVDDDDDDDEEEEEGKEEEEQDDYVDYICSDEIRTGTSTTTTLSPATPDIYSTTESDQQILTTRTSQSQTTSDDCCLTVESDLPDCQYWCPGSLDIEKKIHRSIENQDTIHLEPNKNEEINGEPGHVLTSPQTLAERLINEFISNQTNQTKDCTL